MKVLFVMRHAGFVRNYEPALRLLVQHGHRVHVAYEIARNKYGENVQVERLAAEYPAITHGPAPAREDNLRIALTTIVRTLLDYLRYFDPQYASAPKLRDRAEKYLPPSFVGAVRLLARCGRAPVAAFAGVLRMVDRAIPPSHAVFEFVRDQDPNLVVVTPLVDFGSELVDYVKSARLMGIPSALGVASWDNLTNKGLIKMPPDRVFVWNEAQRVEAETLHGVARDAVVVTGAQIFDHWFEWGPSRTREEFCRTVGLDADRPYILYLGSSFFLAPNEAEVVERWIASIRHSGDSVLSRAGILIRPHPNNSKQWIGIDLSRFGNVGLWPPPLTDPFDHQFKFDYYDSLFHSGAVVGVNTSALIEAAIVGRVVCTLRVPEFEHSQEGTLHFQHLVSANGGLLHVADTMEEHVAQLREVLEHPAEMVERSRRFVESFVRPFGLDTPATPKLVQAIEELGSSRARPQPMPIWASAVRFVLVVPAWLLRAEWNRKGRPIWVMPVRPAVALAVWLAAPFFRAQMAIGDARRHLSQQSARRSKRVRRAFRTTWYETAQRASKSRTRALKRARRLSKSGRKIWHHAAAGGSRRLRSSAKAARKFVRRAGKILARRGRFERMGPTEPKAKSRASDSAVGQ